MTYCNPTQLVMAIGSYTVSVRNFKLVVVIFYWTNRVVTDENTYISLAC